jgi:hypothetical protein
MAETTGDYVTFREIAADCAKRVTKEYSVAYEEYFKELIGLYLSGCGNQTLKVYGSSSSLFGKDLPTELRREAFWRLVKNLDCMPREIRKGPENSPPHGSPLWEKMASVELADYPEPVQRGHLNCLYVRIEPLQGTQERQVPQEPEEPEDVRKFALHHGPPWLVDWFEARDGRPLESLERAVQIWLDRLVKTAEQSGQQLDAKQAWNNARVRYSRLRREQWRGLWASVPDTVKHRGRPSRKSK